MLCGNEEETISLLLLISYKAYLIDSAEGILNLIETSDSSGKFIPADIILTKL